MINVVNFLGDSILYAILELVVDESKLNEMLSFLWTNDNAIQIGAFNCLTVDMFEVTYV